MALSDWFTSQFRRRIFYRRVASSTAVEDNKYLIAAALALLAGVITWFATSPFDGVELATDVTPTTIATAPVSSRAIDGRPLIVDGDTLAFDRQLVRIAAVDAPERGQFCLNEKRETWPCGKQAATALADWVGLSTISCTPIGKDQYGRTVAICSAAGDDVGAWLVANGWAHAAPQTDHYTDEERRARAVRRGVWRGEHLAPWDWRAVNEPRPPPAR